jgi:transcription elongation factor Elf1
MSASEDIAFTCPECGETMVVNPAMRDALLSNGCVVCGAAVTEDAFEVADATQE